MFVDPSETAHLTVFNLNNQVAADLPAKPNGRLELALLRGAEMKPAAIMVLTSEGIAMMGVFGKDQQSLGMLQMTAKNAPSLTLSDKNGQAIVVAEPKAVGVSATMHNSAEKASLLILPGTVAGATVTDKNGRERGISTDGIR